MGSLHGVSFEGTKTLFLNCCWIGFIGSSEPFQLCLSQTLGSALNLLRLALGKTPAKKVYHPQCLTSLENAQDLPLQPWCLIVMVHPSKNAAKLDEQ